MAIPHVRREPISRNRGQSIIAKAAYNSCSRLTASDGEKDFTKKTGLAYQQMITTDGQPIDREFFWQEVEKAEKRKDSQLGYSYTIALPIELNTTQQIALAQDFSQQILKKYNFKAVDLCIHHPTKRKKTADTEKENPHIHLLTSTRTKSGEKLRLFGKTDDLLDVRHLWEETANRHLAAAGSTTRISVDTLEKQIADKKAQLQTLETEIQGIKTEIRSLEDERTNAGTNLDTERNNDSPKPTSPRPERHREPPRPAGSDNKTNEQRPSERLANDRTAAGPADNRRTGTRREHRPTGNSGTNPQPRAENQPIRIEFETVEEKLRTLIKIQDLKTLHPNPIAQTFKRITQKLREYIRLTDEQQLKRIIEDELNRNDHTYRDSQREEATQAPHP